MSRKYIAKQLKRLREQSGLTAAQVGEAVGKSGKTVNAWENNRGQPDAEILMKLCDIYNVTDILSEFNPEKGENNITLSLHEIKVITAYRDDPSMQVAVDRLLNVHPEDRSLNNKKSAEIGGNNIADDVTETIRDINNVFSNKNTGTK